MFDIKHIRSQFPILETKVYGKPLIYLDSGATAQKPKAVIDMVNYLNEQMNANVHRGVHYLSEETTLLYESARERIAQWIGAPRKEEVIFTSGATAGLNIVAQSWGDRFISEGDNIVISEMEHHSNLVPWQMIAQRKGAELRVLPFDDSGQLIMERLSELLDSRTKVVAITQASNTLGTRPDLKTIIEQAHSVGAIVVVDGCQGIVHGGVNLQELGCDFYAFSGHKLYAPTGIGVLWGKSELLEQMPPFLYGGDMVDRVSFESTTFAPIPLKFEAGTSNYAGAIALAEAVKFMESLPLEQIEEHEKMLLERATKGLLEIEGLKIYGTTENKSSIISFTIEGTHPYDIGMILDKLGIAIRTGQHCAEPVMAHYGLDGMCRASFAMYNTQEEVDAFIEGVKRAAKMLK